MPGGNRKGPSGQGAMTGRGVGYCAGNNRPGYMSSGFGTRGFGYGNRNMWWQESRDSWQLVHSNLTKRKMEISNIEQEKVTLNEQVEYLNNVLKDIKSRIAELDKRGELHGC